MTPSSLPLSVASQEDGDGVRVVATAGHVDHGKSSLVLALTGTDPDRFEEEKRRGLTIDLGFAHTGLPSGAQVSFVDVPGHVRFLRNMLAGVGGVDAYLFVVAATEGWKPQSEEHLRILEVLGARHGLIAMTKRGLVDDEWAEIARLEIADHVTGTFLDGAPIVDVDSLSGDGLTELGEALDVLLAATPAAADRRRPRLWIDRVFAARGSGTVVTGTLTGGHLERDQEVVVEPGGHVARIRSIQTLGTSVDSIGPGNRVALNLNGVDHDRLERGDAVVTPGRWRVTDRIDASLDVLAGLDHEVSRRGAYAAYIGSRELAVRLRVLGSDALAPGSTGAVRLFLPTVLPLLPGDRFVLRESGRDETVGGGEVLDIAPVLRASRARPDRSVDRVVAERGWIDVVELELLTGVETTATVGRWVTTDEELTATRSRLQQAITTAGEFGLDLALLSAHERAVVETMDDVTVDAGRVRTAEAVDPFTDHPLAAAVRAGGFTPELPADTDRDVVRELVRRGIVVERDKVVFHRDAIDAAAQIAAALLAADPAGFTVADFRDRTGASRKYALPLVAELDARGITRRREDLRIAGPRLPGLDDHSVGAVADGDRRSR
jgi:selenocysteine-specific elongation factor